MEKNSRDEANFQIQTTKLSQIYMGTFHIAYPSTSRSLCFLHMQGYFVFNLLSGEIPNLNARKDAEINGKCRDDGKVWGIDSVGYKQFVCLFPLFTRFFISFPQFISLSHHRQGSWHIHRPGTEAKVWTMPKHKQWATLQGFSPQSPALPAIPIYLKFS